MARSKPAARARHLRRLSKRQRRVTQKSRSPLHGQKQIITNIPERELSDRLTLVLEQNSVPHKVAAVFFRKQTADLYVAVPYLNVSSFRAGILEGIPGESQQYTPEYCGPHAVKLSYHESGQVHIKEQRLGGKILAEVQARPIREWDGQQIFGIELEGLEHFDEAKPRELARGSTIAISLPQKTWRLRIIGFAGYSEQQITNKYGNGAAPSITLKFVRERFVNPIYVGIYVLTGPSLQKPPREALYITYAGFQSLGKTVLGVYVQASGFKPRETKTTAFSAA